MVDDIVLVTVHCRGQGSGVLIWTAFLFSDHPLGCSTAYAKSAGMVESALSRRKTEQMPYYQKVTPMVDWQWILIIGLIIGASSRLISPVPSQS